MPASVSVAPIYVDPELITEALNEFATTGIKIHFVANIDGYDLSHALEHLDPETTLFIVASKSFSTLETLENARSARNWFWSEPATPTLSPNALSA